VSRRRLIVIGMVALLGLYAGGTVSDATFAHNDPTAVTLDWVDAIPGTAQVEVQWATTTELDTAGFNVLRSTSESGPWEQANDYLIVAQGNNTGGAEYSFPDVGLTGGIKYYYMLQEIPLSGAPHDFTDKIVSATPDFGVYLPIVIGE
jgi:hypothetical protein